jgi:hypothetical protein
MVHAALQSGDNQVDRVGPVFRHNVPNALDVVISRVVDIRRISAAVN